MRERTTPWRLSTAQRIVALSLLLLASALAAALGTLHLPTYNQSHPHLAWPVLLVLFSLSQAYGLVLQDQRESRVVFLSEIPFVLALVYSSPTDLIVARVLAPALLYGVIRRIRPIKLGFNLALASWEACVGLFVVAFLLDGGSPVDAFGWLALLAATVISSTTAAVVVEVAVALADHLPLRPRVLVSVIRAAGLAAAMATTVGIVVARSLLGDLVMAVPLAACGAVLLFAYRAYSALFDRHLSLERLYRFSRAVSSSPEVDEVLSSVIVQAKEMLHAEVAEVVFVPDDLAQPSLRTSLSSTGALLREEGLTGPAGRWLLDRVVRPESSLLIARDTKAADELAYLRARDLREVVVVPLRGEVGVIGLLLVGNRLGEIRGFDREDVRLGETVANHAGIALRNGQLIGQLRHDAHHDNLTGLPNRVLLQQQVERALANLASDPARGFAVLLMDLDGFKDVNDSLGHQQGDLLLKEVAIRLQTTVGSRGLVARLGGDEFAVLLNDCQHVEAAMQLGRDLLAALEQPVPLQEIEVDIAASIGVALAPLHAQDASSVLKRADMAMYAAKANRRGVVLYDRELDTSSPHKLALVGELRAALTADAIEIFVQPQARLDTGEVRSVEVLARWNHPVHGSITPDEFIPLAERTGLIRPLTEAVLAQSMAAAATWWAAGVPVRISVNLSARSLLDDELELRLQRQLSAYGLPASALTVEITESSVMSDPPRTIRLLERLRAGGIRLSVDDFGTGYSSLSYLRQLPIHEVKIDKSFVSRAVDDPNDRAIVRSILDLGANLNLDVVAEGVETERVRDLLADLGCGAIQGYYLARPMAPDQLLGWLADYQPGTTAARAGAGADLLDRPLSVGALVPAQTGLPGSDRRR